LRGVSARRGRGANERSWRDLRGTSIAIDAFQAASCITWIRLLGRRIVTIAAHIRSLAGTRGHNAACKAAPCPKELGPRIMGQVDSRRAPR
jgi:hypothetical protein